MAPAASTWCKRSAFGVVGLLCLIVALDRMLPPPIKGLQTGSLVRDRHGAPLRAFPIVGGRWRLPAHLDDIDPDYIAALLAYEDKRYDTHPGVDPLAVLRATADALTSGRIVSGASTLTMQTARLLEPAPRTLPNKLWQMARALQLEWHLSKPQILELYLTLAPYGGNLEGVRAASWAYFGQEPVGLTREQIALLVALPQSPETRRPDLHPDRAVEARGRVLARLEAYGLLAPGSAADAAKDPAPTRRAFPALAWHASEEVRRRSGGIDAASTLDASLQQRLEALISAVLPREDQDVQMALIVVDNGSSAVRALVGSAERGRGGGWLDLTDRRRSPGSTLKPFIYGLALDDGLATPGTRIADLPRRFHGYRPDNFDRTFRGDVTITEALQHSLNVPAVLALDQVGAHRFRAALDYAGAHTVTGQSGLADAGLAIALGGAGLTLRDVATLYAALGNGGRARPLRWLDAEPLPGAGAALLSEQGARDILDILREGPHPAGRMPATLAANAPDVAFKTGTSYGFRDAWAAGVAGGHTIIVWVGRADGAPRPGATGREAALPILFEAFDVLAQHRRGSWQARTAQRLDPPTPASLQSFEQDVAPHILFPPDGSEVIAPRQGAGLMLAARGGPQIRWYVDGAALPRDMLGETRWSPEGPGFYRLVAIDAMGQQSASKVRIVGLHGDGRPTDGPLAARPSGKR